MVLRLRVGLLIAIVVILSACMSEPAAPVEKTWVEVAREVRANNSVVRIRVALPQTPLRRETFATGTGIVIDEEGHILTNAHVIQGQNTIEVFGPNDSSGERASIVGINQCEDLALLKVASTDGLKPMPIGDSDLVEVGQDVAALGYPQAFDIGTDLSITDGIVSSKGNFLKDNAEFGYLTNLIQTSAPISGGNSGGPLVNRTGQVIGINTFVLSALRAQNINFAISINHAMKRAEELNVDGGKNRLWIGLNLVSHTEITERYFGTGLGLVVEGVDSDSPASWVGIEPADLLLSFAGEELWVIDPRDNRIRGRNRLCELLDKPDGTVESFTIGRVEGDDLVIYTGKIAIGDAEKSGTLGGLEEVQRHPLERPGPPDQPAAAEGRQPDNPSSYIYSFERDIGDWTVGSSGGANLSLSDGIYTLRTSNQTLVSVARAVPASANLTIAARARLEGNANAGLTLHTDDSGANYVSCWIGAGNVAGCHVSNNGTQQQVAQPQVVAGLNANEGAELLMAARGPNILFMVNGKEVKTFSDPGHTFGRPGLIMRNFGSGGLAAFDEVQILVGE